MRLVYLCSPYRGDYETNIRLAKQYCKNALESGVVAFHNPLRSEEHTSELQSPC